MRLKGDPKWNENPVFPRSAEAATQRRSRLQQKSLNHFEEKVRSISAGDEVLTGGRQRFFQNQFVHFEVFDFATLGDYVTIRMPAMEE